jgi:hypothetical protein
MPSIEVRVTHPSGAPWNILDSEAISHVTISNEEDNWARMTFSMSTRYELFSDESNASNPLQVNSYIYVYRGSQYIFRGYVHEITRNDVACELTVTCISSVARINGALALLGGNNIGSIASPIKKLTSKQLYQLASTSGYSAGNEWHYYPGFVNSVNHDATYAWVSQSNSRASTITAAITTSSATITVADGSFFSAPCFVSVDDELIYCDNLSRNAAADWILSIAERGCCGTSNANHADDTAIYQRRVKPFVMDAEYGMARDPSVTIVPFASYRMVPTEGRVDFAVDPTGWTNIDLTYYMYDIDDDADGLTLANVITSVLTGSVNDEGPGLSAGGIDTTGLVTTLLATVNLPQVTYAMDFVRQLIDETWANGLTASKRIVIDYDANADDVVIKSITQGAATTKLNHATEVTHTLSLDRLYSCALVTFNNTQSTPLLSFERCWHPGIGDDPNTSPNSGTVTDNWTAIMFQDIERADAAGWQEDTGTASHNIYTDRLFDGDLYTGWGIKCGMPYYNAADNPIYAVFAWFPNATPLTITSARFVVDMRNWIINPSYSIELVGFKTYTPGTPPTLGTVVDLGLKTSLVDGTHPLEITPGSGGSGGQGMGRQEPTWTSTIRSNWVKP